MEKLQNNLLRMIIMGTPGSRSRADFSCSCPLLFLFFNCSLSPLLGGWVQTEGKRDWDREIEGEEHFPQTVFPSDSSHSLSCFHFTWLLDMLLKPQQSVFRLRCCRRFALALRLRSRNVNSLEIITAHPVPTHTIKGQDNLTRCASDMKPVCTVLYTANNKCM